MKSKAAFIFLIMLLLAGSVSAQQRITDYSQVNRLRWLGPEPPDTYAEYLAKHPPRALEVVPVRRSTLYSPVAAEPLRVLVIVNSTLFPNIHANVDRYVLDIEGQGYAVDLYTSTHGTAEDLKSFIISQSTDLVGCVLIGSLPCAWYEIENDFGDSGYTSFPCDLFLMDLDGNWQDLETAYPMQSGVYDTHSGSGSTDTAPEIFLGRIDERLGCRILLEEGRCHLVYHGVGALRGEDRGDEELERAPVVEHAVGVGEFGTQHLDDL